MGHGPEGLADAAAQLLRLVRVALEHPVQVFVEGVGERVERQRVLVLRELAADEAHPAPRQVRLELGHEPRLADPGDAAHQGQPAAPFVLGDAVILLDQCGELFLAADQRHLRRHRLEAVFQAEREGDARRPPGLFKHRLGAHQVGVEREGRLVAVVRVLGEQLVDDFFDERRNIRPQMRERLRLSEDVLFLKLTCGYWLGNGGSWPAARTRRGLASTDRPRWSTGASMSGVCSGAI